MTSLVLVKRHDHVAKSDMRSSPTVVKVFENKFGQVVEKSFEFVFCLFGFVKATKFRDSSEYTDCVQNVRAKKYFPCQNYRQRKNKFCRARKRPSTSLALQCYKVNVGATGDKGKLFVLFIPLFTLFLFNKIVYALWSVATRKIRAEIISSLVCNLLDLAVNHSCYKWPLKTPTHVFS